MSAPSVHNALTCLSALALLAPVSWAGCNGCGSAPARPDSEAARKIQALPYLSSAPVTPTEQQKVGVTLHRRGEASPGLTAYCSEGQDQVRFVDLDGVVRHTITVPGANCKLLEPTGQGDFLMLGRGVLTRVDWQGKVAWQRVNLYDPERPGRQLSFHHDVDVSAGGEIYVLTNHNRLVPHKGVKIPIRDDDITVLDARGGRLRSTSVWDLLGKRVSGDRLDQILSQVKELGLKGVGWGDVADVLHTNTLEVLERDTAMGRAGLVLIAVRYLDLMAVVDLRLRAVVWFWGPGELEWPHHPSLLASGHLLLFDNGSRRRWSRVLELSPSSRGSVVWEYRAHGDQTPLFTDTRGSAQVLDNGDVLITESDTGRLLEVERTTGRILWEYYNPDMVTVPEAGAIHDSNKKGENKKSEKQPEKGGAADQGVVEKGVVEKKVEQRVERRLIYRATRYTPANLDVPGFKALYGSLPDSGPPR